MVQVGYAEHHRGIKGSIINSLSFLNVLRDMITHLAGKQSEVKTLFFKNIQKDNTDLI